MDKTMLKKAYKNTTKGQTLKLVKMGMLIAVSIALVYLIHFPIVSAVPFLTYAPVDISILLERAP